MGPYEPHSKESQLKHEKTRKSPMSRKNYRPQRIFTFGRSPGRRCKEHTLPQIKITVLPHQSYFSLRNIFFYKHVLRFGSFW